MKHILRLVKTYIVFLIIFVIQKPIFLLLDKSSATTPVDDVFSSVLQVMWHGLPLDCAMAGYFMILPGLLCLLTVWTRGTFARTVSNLYFGISAFCISLCFVLNVALYPFWNFPLDSTPLFYFFTSPVDAFASVSLWFVLGGVLCIAVCTVLVFLALRQRRPKRKLYSYARYVEREKHRLRTSVVLVLLTALLFIPIRGGFSVSTNNTGKAYFCQNTFLNHAAVNPMFSLMESLTHHNDFGSQYRFMEDAEATEIFRTMVSDNDQNTWPLLREGEGKTEQPDILFIIMEGFANDMMPSVGSLKVTTCLDSIAQQGIFFTNFYANSFRTDRGLVSILSGYPAQPTTSVMRYPEKAAHLPSLVRTLAEKRKYGSSYYYGGDVDFAFQRSYLVSQGFQRIISDANFPIKSRMSKWGVPDHLVANKLMADIRAEKNQHPMFRVFQTSSSHEPFDVPYHRLKDERLNAFAYADSVIGNLIRQYKKLPQWRNTLIVLVPDHVGSYKEHLDLFTPTRYQIPLILTGGAISGPMKIKLLGSQIDIAATLLAQLGLKHSDFTFSKNIMSDATPKFAFFTVPDAFGVVSEENNLIYDNPSEKTVYDNGTKPGYNLQRGKAYLQKLYDDLNDK